MGTPQNTPLDTLAAMLRVENEKLIARRWLGVPDDVSSTSVDLAIEQAVQLGFRTAAGITERVTVVLRLRK